MQKIFTTVLASLLLLTALPTQARYFYDVSFSPQITTPAPTGIAEPLTLSAQTSELAGKLPKDYLYQWSIIHYPTDYTNLKQSSGYGLEYFTFTPNIPGKYAIQLTLTDRQNRTAPPDFITVDILPFDEYFTDLPAEHPAREHFFNLFKAGVMRGYPDRTMKPDDLVNRAEFVVMCFRALAAAQDRHIDDISISFADVYFADVSPYDWYFKEMVAALEHGIIEGYTDRTFRPSQTVSRAEALKVALRFTDLPLILNTTTLTQMKDIPATEWYARYFTTAYQIDLINSTDGYFYPHTDITRAEAAKIIDLLFFNPTHTKNIVNFDVFRQPRDY